MNRQELKIKLDKLGICECLYSLYEKENIDTTILTRHKKNC